jgi:DNA-binding transcriptional regulator YhcF (GntR family)
MEAPFGIELDRKAEVPVGVQLAWALRARILARELSPGARLPGVRDLAAAIGVNVNTVRAVYARLEAEGLVRAEHGRGTFVAETVPADDILSAVARRALDDARAAGIDPREVAAAMYAGAVPAAPPGEQGADATDRRRRLRAEIAELERELADARLTKTLGRWHEEPAGQRATSGGRLLAEEELRALRDELAAQAALLREMPDGPPAPIEAGPPINQHASSLSATRPRPVRWTISFGRS